MKLKYRRIAFIMAMLLLLNATPILGNDSMSINDSVANYMDIRTVALIFGKTDVLNECSVMGITEDENEHYEALRKEELQVVASTYEIISTDVNEVEAEVILEETIYYLQDWDINSEVVYHVVSLVYDEENVPIIVSDSYYEEYSGFVSASYVNPYAVVLADEAGSDECIVRVAGTQVGYLEKETNSNLDSFTANAGDENYTKYGKWYGSNGVPWCAIFVSWCADQANVSTSIIKKTASCDTSMSFFKSVGNFEASSAYGGDYTPEVGDIFFYGTSASDATHTGIVAGVNSSYITVIHGNSNNQVRKSTYSLSNTGLLGYGTPAYANDIHSYEYSSTSSGHTGTCCACGYTTALTPHTINYSYNASSHSGYCSECGYYMIPTNHTHSYKSNSSGHWSECSVCGYQTSETEHTWQNMGAYTKCIYCGKYKE